LNGASGDAGLEVRGGYYLQWAIVLWLKENGLLQPLDAIEVAEKISKWLRR
jgi:hypothetical protein